MLKEVFAEDEHVEKPILDEQKQMENGMLLHAALHGDLSVEIKYYTNGTFETTQGKILFIDAMGRLLRMEDKEIDIDDIMDVII